MRRLTLLSVLIQIIPLILLATLLLFLLSMGAGGQVAHLQSPVSPVLPGGAPTEALGALPGISPVAPGPLPGTSPLVPRTKPLIRLPRLSVPVQWSSPWPWVVVGVVFFGGLAWALIAVFQRFESSKGLSEKPSQAPDTEPPIVPDTGSPAALDTEPSPAPEAQDEGEFQIEIK